MKKISLFLLIAFCFSSCKNNHTLVDNSFGLPQSLVSLEIDIDLDEVSLNSYYIHSGYVYQGDDYLLAYNHNTNDFDVFNISTKAISHIKLMPEGPNGIFHPGVVYAHAVDSIWVYTEDNVISLVDSAGIVKERISIPESDTMPFLMVNFSLCTAKLYFHASRKSLFYLSFAIKNDKNNFYAQEYSLSDHSVKFYPLKAIEDYDFRNQYGWKQFPNVTFNEHSILYNFPVESNIYVLDIESGKTSVYGGKSRFTPNQVSKLIMPYSFEQANRHLCENVHFYEILYEPEKDIYYRLHSGRIDFDSHIDFYSLVYSKEIFLTVFNNKFEIINETKLDRQKYNIFNCWGVTGKGFFIGKDNLYYQDINYEQLQLDVFNLEDYSSSMTVTPAPPN